VFKSLLFAMFSFFSGDIVILNISSQGLVFPVYDVYY